MKIRHIITILLLISCGAASAETNSISAEFKSIRLDSNGVPFGSLGFPVGSYLTIEGVKEKREGFQNQHWLVDKVNGRKLNEPVSIELGSTSMIKFTNNVDIGSLQDGQRFIFKGYETFEMMGIPPAEEMAAIESGQGLPTIPYIGWCIHYYFVILPDVSPNEDKS